MKITHIISDKNIGGAGKLLCYLIDASDREKFEYSAIIPHGSKLKNELEKRGVRSIEIDNFDSSFSPKASKDLVKAIRDLSPDIVHTHSSLSGQLAAKKAGVKHRVMTKHCSDMPTRRMRLVARLASKIYWSGIERFIATDDSAAAALRAIGAPKKKIAVIYNGSPDMAERIKPEVSSCLRKKLGIPESALVVGYFGRLEPEKGPAVLLQAASLCRRVTPDIHFLFCGTGSQEQELHDLAKRFGIEDGVNFTGFVENTADYMSICKIIASPSLGVETSSLSLCEGLSLGLVPVVTDIGGSRALIGDCGLCIKPDDAPALYAAIMELARDPDLISLYSKKARARYAGRCTSGRMADETCRIYLDVARLNGVC